MRRKRIPYYLVRLLDSYFGDRNVKYVIATGKLEERGTKRSTTKISSRADDLEPSV